MSERKSFNSKFYILEAKTPVHTGSGEGDGSMDLPIQREAVTQFPTIHNTAWKGAVKAIVSGAVKAEEVEKTPLNFTDLKMLLFPVKSSYGLFSYVTCPIIIKRFLTVMYQYKSNIEFMNFMDTMANYLKWLNDSNALVPYSVKPDYVILENFKVKVSNEPKITEAIKQFGAKTDAFRHLLEKMVVVSNKNFQQFVLQSTEKIIRNKVQDYRSINIFSEEFLPEGTVLYGGITEFIDIPTNQMKGTLDKIHDNIPDEISIGGDYSLGKGVFKIYKEELNGSESNCFKEPGKGTVRL